MSEETLTVSKSTRIVIIGRPNVGKSTLFNRLVGRRRALVHDMPGVTRDRMEERSTWWMKRQAYPVSLVDTGGLGGDRFAQEIEDQVTLALEEADVTVMLFDGQAGLTPADQVLLKKLRTSGVEARMPVIGVVNKVDEEMHESMISEFYAAGLDTLLTISAEHGRGIEDLEHAILEAANAKAAAEGEVLETETPRSVPRVAILGRPNVGKSTFVNALLGQTRMITSPIAGTTVDAIDSVAEIGGKRFVLIDTAGIRRKNKTEQGVEVLSVVQARKALERADVAVLVLDGEIGPSDQDEKIAGLLEEAGCGVIMAINKWDTQRGKKDFDKQDAAERIRKQIAFLKYAPLFFMSAIEGRGFEDLGNLVEEILHQRQLKIPTHELTEWVRKESTIHNPMNAKFYMSHQAGRYPPTFVCHVNDPDKVHFSLQRHLVNAMRERWGFMGSPVKMLFVPGHGKKKDARDQARRN